MDQITQPMNSDVTAKIDLMPLDVDQILFPIQNPVRSHLLLLLVSDPSLWIVIIIVNFGPIAFDFDYKTCLASYPQLGRLGRLLHKNFFLLLLFRHMKQYLINLIN